MGPLADKLVCSLLLLLTTSVLVQLVDSGTKEGDICAAVLAAKKLPELFCVGFNGQNILLITHDGPSKADYLVYDLPISYLNRQTHQLHLNQTPTPLAVKWPELVNSAQFKKINLTAKVAPFTTRGKSGDSWLVLYGDLPMNPLTFNMVKKKARSIGAPRWTGSVQEFVSSQDSHPFEMMQNRSGLLGTTIITRNYTENDHNVKYDIFVGDDSWRHYLCQVGGNTSQVVFSGMTELVKNCSNMKPVAGQKAPSQVLYWPRMPAFRITNAPANPLSSNEFYFFDQENQNVRLFNITIKNEQQGAGNISVVYTKSFGQFFVCPRVPLSTPPTVKQPSTAVPLTEAPSTEASSVSSTTKKSYLVVIIVVFVCLLLVAIIAIIICCLFCCGGAAKKEDNEKKTSAKSAKSRSQKKSAKPKAIKSTNKSQKIKSLVKSKMSSKVASVGSANQGLLAKSSVRAKSFSMRSKLSKNAATQSKLLEPSSMLKVSTASSSATSGISKFDRGSSTTSRQESDITASKLAASKSNIKGASKVSVAKSMSDATLVAKKASSKSSAAKKSQIAKSQIAKSNM